MNNRIKILRQEAEMSQKDLANDLGVSQGTISNWENGTHAPDSVSQLYLCYLFRCTSDYLLGVGKDAAPGHRGWTPELELSTAAYLQEKCPGFVLREDRESEMRDATEHKWLAEQVSEEDPADRQEAVEQYLRDKWEESGRIGTVEGFAINMITENLTHEDRVKLLNVVQAMFPEESAF